MQPKIKWHTGAYLSIGELWFCLSLDDVHPCEDYTHIAFDIAEGDFGVFAESVISKWFGYKRMETKQK